MSRGFTLLELLVAMLLLGLLTLPLFGSLRLGARTWSAAEAGAARVERLMAGQEALRRQIATALPRRDDAPFEGTARTLSFAGHMPMAGVPGWAMVRLRHDGGRLLLAWQPLYPDGSRGDSAETPLLDDVADVAFSYLGDEGWRSEWSGRDLPALVRLEASFTDGARWPPFVVRPAAR